MRIIDADALKREIKKYIMTSGVTNQGTWNECINTMLNTVNDMPTVDRPELECHDCDHFGYMGCDDTFYSCRNQCKWTPRTGEWLKYSYLRKCSVCGSSTCWTDVEGSAIPDKYCPNCGSRMNIVITKAKE